MACSSSLKPLTVNKYSSSASNHVGSATGCTVPAGGTAVLWCYRYSYFTDNQQANEDILNIITHITSFC